MGITDEEGEEGEETGDGEEAEAGTEEATEWTQYKQEWIWSEERYAYILICQGTYGDQESKTKVIYSYWNINETKCIFNYNNARFLKFTL